MGGSLSSVMDAHAGRTARGAFKTSFAYRSLQSHVDDNATGIIALPIDSLRAF